MLTGIAVNMHGAAETGQKKKATPTDDRPASLRRSRPV
jgi:hypothetical protein